MCNDYDLTPSFYNSIETFNKFLANTSYYINLQKSIHRLIKLSKANKVLELGTATGATLLMLADSFPDISFVGVDIRNDIIKIAMANAEEKEITNVTFSAENIIESVKQPLEADFIFLLYSFHHVPDPLSLKTEFLNNLYSNMKYSSYLCIAETFLPENLTDIHDSEKILSLWTSRKEEGYTSTFWSAIEGLTPENIKAAEEVADYCRNKEYLAGELVATRDNEYLVKTSWLLTEAINIGFEVVLNMPVNIVEDRVVLLKKNS